MTDIKVGLCTCPNREVAMAIATVLVSEKLAACVNLIDKVTSVYEWDGEVQCDTEVQLVVKTHTAKLDKVWESIRQNHPYDVPEWLTIDVNGGSQEYLNWIKSSLS